MGGEREDGEGENSHSRLDAVWNSVAKDGDAVENGFAGRNAAGGTIPLPTTDSLRDP